MDRVDESDVLPFVRARTPEQRSDRMAHVARVTRALLDDTRAADLTLGQIATATGLAKSGVLRYAGSREALLLLVMYQEHLAWLAELQTRLAHSRRDLAQDVAHTLARRTVLCDLISAAPVLMSGLEPKAGAAVRTQARDIEDRLGLILAPRLPLDRQRLLLLTAAIHAFAGSVWGWAATTSDVGPVFAGDLEPILTALLHTFIKGLQHN